MRSGPVLSQGLPLPALPCPALSEVWGSAGSSYITSPAVDEAAAGTATLPHTSITSLQWAVLGPWVEAKPAS